MSESTQRWEGGADLEPRDVERVFLARLDVNLRRALALVAVPTAIVMMIALGRFDWPLFLVIVLLVSIVLFEPKLAARLFARSVIGARVDYVVDGEGITVTTAEGTTTTRWDELRSYRDTKEAFLVYKTKSAHLPLLKRAFTEEQQQALHVELERRFAGYTPSFFSVRSNRMIVWVALVVGLLVFWEFWK